MCSPLILSFANPVWRYDSEVSEDLGVNIQQHQPERSGRISAITIQGFRSLANIEQLQLPQLSVLIGSNGAGKSTLIRFFSLVGSMLRGQRLQEFVLRHGGGDDQLFMGAKQTPQIQANIQIQSERGRHDYTFELSYNPAQDSLYLSREAVRFVPDQSDLAPWHELPMPARESQLVLAAAEKGRVDHSSALIVNVLQRCATYQFHDTSENAYIKKPWDIEDCAWLRDDGGNLAAILYRLQHSDAKRYQLIVRQIQRVLPTFAEFVLEPIHGKVALRWRGRASHQSFGAHLTSDGSLCLFSLLTLINLPSDMLPDVLFLDEPELGLHPHAITLVAAGLKRLSHQHQIFIATQSPHMVDCFDVENIIVAKLTNDGATTLSTLQRSEYQQWLDEEYQLSDLWLTDVIGSNV